MNSIIVPQLENRAARKEKLSNFFSSSTVAAAFMVIAAIAAVIVANTDLYSPIQDFLSTFIGVYAGGYQVGLSIELFVNDLLMTIFFLMIGIELKYEMTVGELTDPKAAALPMFAALGGVAVPALIYFGFNSVMPGGELHGWAIPMATDIAFALGVMALLGDKVPHGAKVFFTTLAIADDIVAIIVIALFYGSSPQMMWLLASAFCVVVLIVFNKMRIYRLWPYLLMGVVLWVCVFNSGIHATIAGVVLAFCIPAKPMVMLDELPKFASEKMRLANEAYIPDAHPMSQKEYAAHVAEVEKASHYAQPPLIRLEHALNTFSNFVVLPLFAFFNAQIRLVGVDLGALVTSPVTLGVFLGLLIGKPIGIFGVTFALVKAKVADLPRNVTWFHIAGVGILAGIGFTMAILIAGLAFSDEAATTGAKTAILSASVVAAVIGLIFLSIDAKIHPAKKAG